MVSLKKTNLMDEIETENPQKNLPKWQLIKKTSKILKSNKRLLLFSFYNKLFRLLIITCIASPLLVALTQKTTANELVIMAKNFGIDLHNPWFYVVALLLFWCAHVIAVFFYSALVASTLTYFEGKSLSLMKGFKMAKNVFFQLCLWSIINTTLGAVLKIMAIFSPQQNSVFSQTRGNPWRISIYFVFPIIVMEKINPLKAFHRSLDLLSNTWGDSLQVNFKGGSLLLIFLILAYTPILIGFKLGGILTIATSIGIAIPLIMTVNLFSSTLHLTLCSALYLYATERKVVPPYEEKEMKYAFISLKSKSTFLEV